MTMVMFRGGAVLVVVMTAAPACTTRTTDPSADETGPTTSVGAGASSSSDTGSMPGACTGEHNVIIDDTCQCEEPYEWCEPNDPNDFSCCGSSPPNPSTTNPGTTTEGSTTEPVDPDTTAGEEGPTPPDPDQCNEASEGAMFCSNTEAQGPQDSALWACTNGAWVDITDTADEQCQFDNYDFAYGCIDNGSMIAFICGNGTGAPCDENDVSMCIDAVEIDTCIWGRATQDSCEAICTTIGDEMGVTYDSGFCDTEAKVAECVCCDVGECP